jgi:hypothetical protein
VVSSRYSPGGAFGLTLQATDGNLVLQTINDMDQRWTSWASPAAGSQSTSMGTGLESFIQGRGVTEVDFQIDGNLVADMVIFLDGVYEFLGR